MKIKLLLALFFLSYGNSALAQYPKDGYKMGKNILSLIKQYKAEELAHLVVYPIQRDNPLPDIKNQKEFISYFPVLFDDKFKKMIPAFKLEYILVRNGSFGMVGGPFNGDIWYDESGIISINYFSDKERALSNSITQKTQAEIHPSVNQWESNLLVVESKNLLVRIDELKGGDLRYVSWSKGKPISEKPDLVLFNGTISADSQPSVSTFVFKNNNWEYIITDSMDCDDCNPSDRILILKENYKQKSRTIMKVIK